ncbi:MAG: porphobilinogen deaminase [Solirubrobacterales bacterium]|nr:porphobilinogen deaminase [Solirubrobacterales bacterium]
MSLRLGTRGSALALAQARLVADALGGAELVVVTTAGDRGEDAGDKSRWVAELEAALLAHDIDFAVHSAKDVPAVLPDGLGVAAAPAREDPRDALCGAASLADLPTGARVGTSSPRRSAQLRAVREDLEVVALRGNVDTRLRKLADGECDAIVLALAGLKRLGREDEATGVLDWLPAAGQGALLLEGRLADTRATALNDPVSRVALEAERALVRTLGATCHTPLATQASVGSGEVFLRAWLGLPDGSSWMTDELRGPSILPERLGHDLGDRMLAAGGRELLDVAEQMATT